MYIYIEAGKPFGILRLEDVYSEKEIWHALEGRIPSVLLQVSRLSLGGCVKDNAFIRLEPRLVGGKGGFGNQLRASGSRMGRKGKNFKNDLSSSRDMSGKRLGLVEKTKKLDEAIQNAPAVQKELLEKKKRKLEAIIGKLDKDQRRIDVDLGDFEEQGENVRQNIQHALKMSTLIAKSAAGATSSDSSVQQSQTGLTFVKRDLADWDELSDISEEDETSRSDESGYASVEKVSKSKGKAVAKQDKTPAKRTRRVK